MIDFFKKLVAGTRLDASLQRRERGPRLVLMAQRLSETDKAAASSEKGDEPAPVLKERPSGQELARASSHHPSGGVRGKGGGWNSHGEPGASTPRGDNEMISTAAVRESKEGNKGSSDRLVR